MITLALCGYLKYGRARAREIHPSRELHVRCQANLPGYVLRLHEFPSGQVYRSSQNLSERSKSLIVPGAPSDGPMHDHDPGHRRLRSISGDFTHH